MTYKVIRYSYYQTRSPAPSLSLLNLICSLLISIRIIKALLSVMQYTPSSYSFEKHTVVLNLIYVTISFLQRIYFKSNSV